MSRTIEPLLAKPAKMAHYVLRVSDTAASVAWYNAVLGMEIVHQNEFLTFLTFDDEHHRMAMVQLDNPPPADPGAPGLDHVAYTLNSLEELLGTYKRLRDLDILPVWPVHHGLTISMYYADPDGNRVEFQVETLGSTEELQAFMQSSEFAADPVGVDYDPEELLSRYEAGEPVEELLTKGALQVQ